MLIRGDARFLPLVDACVDCVITSPPYFGLRDYGHPQQIGLEPEIDGYVDKIVDVFRELWRVLKDNGTVWLNLGDSYANSSDRRTPKTKPPRKIPDGLKPKDLIGVPWRVALALQADGWYLRADIIWSKPNPMPESVTDRPTKAHEYLFLLAKNERYFYDADAIREPLSNYYLDEIEDDRKYVRPSIENFNKQARYENGTVAASSRADRLGFVNPAGRNKRSVWTITTQPYRGAHFATIPEQLVEPCILAGCQLGGFVLDPFVGSGTVVAVAQRLGRRGVGVDLSYQDLAKKRTAQTGLRF